MTSPGTTTALGAVHDELELDDTCVPVAGAFMGAGVTLADMRATGYAPAPSPGSASTPRRS
jgi:hypothetical protein